VVQGRHRDDEVETEGRLPGEKVGDDPVHVGERGGLAPGDLDHPRRQIDRHDPRRAPRQPARHGAAPAPDVEDCLRPGRRAGQQRRLVRSQADARRQQRGDAIEVVAHVAHDVRAKARRVPRTNRAIPHGRRAGVAAQTRARLRRDAPAG
jgi:hypothetical protein